MARKNVSHLRAKPKNRKPKRAGTKPCSYTYDDALLEDGERARRIQSTIKKLPKKTRKPAKRLAEKLSYLGAPPATPASATYLLDLRERIVDHLVRLPGACQTGKSSLHV